MDINSMLSSLLGGLDASSAAVKTEQGRSAETTAGMTGAAANMEGFAADSVVKSVLANQQAAEIERQKAAAGEYAQTVAGLNPDDLNNEYVRTMAELTTVRDQRTAEMDKYRKLTETSFLDNPIGYIFNQLALPQVVQTHNNLATQQDALTGDLATRTQLMYQNKTQVTANVADATKEMRLNEAAATEAAARANVEKLRMENFGKISTARMNELALQDKLNQNTAAKFSAGMQMAQFQAMQAERAEARAERKMRMDAAAKDKAEKDAQDGALAIGLARVSGALGYPAPVSIGDFKKMPASKAKQALYNAAIEGTFGDDLSSSIAFLSGGNITRMQATDPAFVGGLKSIASGVKSYATAEARKLENAKMKPEDATKAGAEQYTLAVTLSAHDPKAAAPLNDARWDTVFNPYRSQDATMLGLVKSGQLPQLANNSFVKVLETIFGTIPPGTSEFRGEDKTNAIKALSELVRTRKISVQQAAADLVTYTKTAAAYNQQTLKLSTLNMPTQESAYVNIPGTAALAKSVVGDTMNLASTENLLVNLAISQARGLSRIPGFGGIENVARKELLDIAPAK